MKKLEVTQTRYLLIESLLFLFFSYLLIAGGINTTNVAGQASLVNFILVALAGLGWFAWRFLRRRAFPATFLDLPILLLLLVTTVTTLTSADPRRSAVILWQLLLYVLFFYLLVDLLRSGLSSDLLEKALLLSSLPVIIYGILEIAGYYASWFGMGGCIAGLGLPSYRVYSTLYSPNILAAYLNLVLPLGIMRGIRSARWARLAWLAWCLVVLALDFFTSSRGGWLGTAAVLGVIALYLCYRWWKNRKKHPGAGQPGPKDLDDSVKQGKDATSQGNTPPPSRRINLNSRTTRTIIIAAGLVLVVLLVVGGITLIAWELNNATHAGSGLSISSRDYLWVVAWKMFLAHPLLGNGPFTYVTQFVQTYSVPPNMMLPHAHNLYINVLGEMGLLGFFAMCTLAGALVWLVYRLWRGSSDTSRMVLVAGIASLAGLAVHNLFDIPTYMPAVAFVAIAIAALLVAADQKLALSHSPDVAKVRLRAYYPVLLVVWLVVALALGWQAWALQPYLSGVAAANQGNWQAAAADLDVAAARDPRLALNWFQAGFAHGMLALDKDGSVSDPGELDLAIQDYQQGLAIEPAYAPNWANLGLLEWAAGNQPEAIRSMQKASALAFSQPAFILTQGRMLESAGKDEAALSAYRQVLQQTPGWAGMLFFQNSSLRQQAAAEVPVAGPPAPSALNLDQLACQVKLDWFQPASGTALANDLFALGDAQSARGQFSDAVQSYRQGLSLLSVVNSYGIGRGGVSEYTVVAFNRLGIETDLLPGIDYPVYNDRVIQAMLDLASAYTSMNDTSSAIQLYNEIIAVDPQNQPAQARLVELNP